MNWNGTDGESNPIFFAPEQRERFRSGDLAREWASRFSDLFDSDDLRLALSQPNNHFCEWLSAILIFETTGWLSLVEKYEFGSHRRKTAIVEKLLPPEVLGEMKSSKIQAPDLLIYSKDFSEWRFCEVKGPGDKIREVQAEQFEKLERVSGKRIEVIYLRESIV